MFARVCFRSLAPLLAISFLTGCFFRHREPERRYYQGPLKEATLEQLVNTINSNASRFQSLRADVNIDTSVGGERKGKITDYKEISGYVLVRKPSMLRMIGLVPVIRSNLFDMVSNGENFELSVPVKNKFIVGSNQVTKISPQPLENLRPQHIMDALLLKAIEAPDIAILEQGIEIVKDPKTHKDVDQPNYVVDVISRDDRGYFLSRKIVFSREDLLPHEQLIYNRGGELATDARYSNFTSYSGLMFPDVIEIDRPLEEYTITLTITKLYVNVPITDDKFALSQPPGSQLVNLDTRSALLPQETSQPRKP